MSAPVVTRYNGAYERARTETWPMGDEITTRYFGAKDFSDFRDRLDAETRLLAKEIEQGAMSPRGDTAGFELEAWLIDSAGDPAPVNERLLGALNNPLVVPELARFNVEFNGSPSKLTGHVFTRLHDELEATWNAARAEARRMDTSIVAIGTLPTARPEDFSAANMSPVVRYQSLNDRVMALRDGRPIRVYVEADPPVSIEHRDVMLEAAATSFQIHLQCAADSIVRDFNASLIASAPMVAVSANAPFLLGRTAWEESRIPIFEQSVDVGAQNTPRVSFGSGYLQHSVMELFEQNQRDFLILIPEVQNAPPEKFAHVRFHNGTIWRWNRPLIGFDFDGQTHLRIEHRVASAGPTLIDCIANAALYYGLVKGFALQDAAPEHALPFSDAKDNFYNAARYGLSAQVQWPLNGDVRGVSMRTLLVEHLLPLAQRGLESLDIPQDEIARYLDVIGARVENSQNGAAWQRRWLAMNEGDAHDMIAQYLAYQTQGNPVHTWPI